MELPVARPWASLRAVMISLEDARQLICSHVAPLPGELANLAEAGGRVLDEAILADEAYPSGDRSTMDGYVIGGDELPGKFSVIGEVAAGATPGKSLGKGEAMRIFTGALIPAGGGRVIMQEDVERAGDEISINGFSDQRLIRTKGSEAQPGQMLLPAGSRLGAAEIAILAQVGAVRPSLIRHPRVRHLATGDELVAPSQTPGSGQIRDTNSSLLATLLSEMGIPSLESTRVADDPAALASLAEGDWDVLLISGGASVGDYDFGAESLRRLGFEIHFSKVNLRPGKPLTFATRGQQIAFVIPGNPVSHFVCFHVAIRLAFERLCGLPVAWDFLTLEIAGGEEVKPDSRETFWPSRVAIQNGRLVIFPKRWSTSGNTFSLAGTNALARVNADSPVNGTIQSLLLHPL